MIVVTARTVLLGGAAALLLLAVFVFRAAPAGAHGVQVASDPAPNAQLEDTPELITVTFNEPIEPSVSTIELWDQTAQPVTLGPLETFDDPKQLGVQMPDDLEPGFYTVVWRNLSTVDGHTWQGSFTFTMLGAGGALPEGEISPAVLQLGQSPSGDPTTLESAARWVVLLGSAVLLGATAYVLVVARPAAGVLAPATATTLRNLSRTVLLVTGAIAVFLVLEGSLLQLLIQADRLGGLGRADDLLVDTRFGRYLIARQVLLGLALLALGLVWRARGRRAEVPAMVLLFVAGLGVLFTQSLVSHAAASDGSFWATTVDVLHLFSAALWVGALIHIGLAMPRWLDALSGVSRSLFAAESFRRFSILAAGSVLVLMSSGVLSALVQFHSWDELWESSYGWSLIGKIGAMVPLLIVAALNAFILQPRVVEAALHIAGGAVDSGEDVAPSVTRLQRLLANTVRAEAVLGIVVLIAVAVLTQLESPRARAEQQVIAPVASAPQPAANEDEPFTANAEVEGVIMALRIDPARVGENTFELGLGAEFGSVGEVIQARLEFDHEREDVGSSRAVLDLSGSAKFTATGSYLSLPGNWTVTANIRRRGADDLNFAFDVPIPEPAAAGGPAAGGPGTGAVAEADDSSIWTWPFEGGRSIAAIAVLAAATAGAAGWGTLALVRRRRA